MKCDIANKNDFLCPGSINLNCNIFLDEGVTIRNKRDECHYKNIRTPRKVVKREKVNPLKASKRKGG